LRHLPRPAAGLPSRALFGGSRRLVAEDPLAALVPAAARGDALAQRDLLESLAPHLRRPLHRLLASSADVEDALQESLMAVVGALPRFRGESTVLHFSIQIAVRCALAKRRRLLRAARHANEVSALELALVETPSPPHQCLVELRRRAALAQLLRDLPPAQAEAVALRVILDHSLEEVASATGVPANTVRTRLRLARRALKRRIFADPSLRELLPRGLFEPAAAAAL
jgi:RNA polymerase sigma-70 factor (ECF subfamily)